MKLVFSLLAVLLAVPSVGETREFDAGNDFSAYLLVSPHPQQGWTRAQRPDRVPPGTDVEPAQPDPYSELMASFILALQTGRFDDAQQHAGSLLEHQGGDSALLDELTYRMVKAGAPGHATRMLLGAYPFAAAAPSVRVTLVQRLIFLVEQERKAPSDESLLPLRNPLDRPALRSRQAAFWADLQDCGTVRAILSDMAPEYGYDDWMRLGDCSTAESPALAQQAYARAHTLQPGGRASRALAYAAHSTGHYRMALDAWRSAGIEGLTAEDLLGAVTTALAAGENEQAVSWLESYRERDHPLNHRYWSLAGQAHANSDTATAVAALARATALQPDIADYLRLSRLERDSARQVLWIERAAALDPNDADLQLELAYAYSRVGQRASARRALERAAVLDPDSIIVQIELGYAYWRAGDAALAQRALEQAWHADPRNLIVAQQLVYVHQRLKHNEQARWYVRQVLDAPSSLGEAASNSAAANQRFGFQRLHEDLGRRVTLTLDGWSGTRVGTGTSASPAGNRYRSYSQFEADVRLGNPPIRDGSTISAYARVLADGGEPGSAVPSRNAMLGAGLRWKPWRSQVIYLAAENQNGLGDHRRREFLLRASASFLNGGRYGDDWHPAGKGWFSRNLYVDAAHYLKTNHGAFTVDYRTSYHRKLRAKQTLEPYGHLQISHLRHGGTEDDVRSGVGLRWNIWHGASHYNADPHKVSVGIEFQQAFETPSSDRRGLFLTLSTRW